MCLPASRFFIYFSTVQMSHLHSLALPARASVRTVQVLRGGLCRSNLLFYWNFWSKEDCHAAEEQERRLAMT